MERHFLTERELQLIEWKLYFKVQVPPTITMTCFILLL